MRSSYRPDYTAPLTKRYYITDTLTNEYPEAFITSPRRRFVHVNKITLIQTLEDDSLYYPKNIELHADFVQDSDYMDHFICFTNQIGEHRKYEQFNSPKFFHMWLTDHNGTKIELTDDYKLVVELMLEY